MIRVNKNIPRTDLTRSNFLNYCGTSLTTCFPKVLAFTHATLKFIKLLTKQRSKTFTFIWFMADLANAWYNAQVIHLPLAKIIALVLKLIVSQYC